MNQSLQIFPRYYHLSQFALLVLALLLPLRQKQRAKQVCSLAQTQALLTQGGRLHRYKPMLPFVLLQTNAVNLRSEPSSRTTLMGEQPNPWNVLPLQDVMSRHRTNIRFLDCHLVTIFTHPLLLFASQEFVC
jgi:hypothetical protein